MSQDNDSDADLPDQPIQIQPDIGIEAVSVPQQPDIGLGSSNNENRRIHSNVEQPSGSGSSSLSFSNFLSRGGRGDNSGVGSSGSSNSGLPDFVQDHISGRLHSDNISRDHLPDIPFDLTQNQSRLSCDSSTNQTLPDFLSDTHRSRIPINIGSSDSHLRNQPNVNRIDEPSSSLSLENSLQLENDNLRMEIEIQRQQIASLRDVISRKDNQIREIRNRTLRNELSSSSGGCVPDLDLRRENRLSTQRNVAQELRSRSQHAENHIRELMTTLSVLKQLAAHLDNVDETSSAHPNRLSDSEDD